MKTLFLTRYIRHLVPLAKVGRSLVVEQCVLHPLVAGATSHRHHQRLLSHHELLVPLAVTTAVTAAITLPTGRRPRQALMLGSPRRTCIFDVLPFLWFVVHDHRRTVAQVGLIDEDRPSVLLLQHLADHPEVRRRLPARLQLAAAGHSVALAANLHVVGHGLE